MYRRPLVLLTLAVGTALAAALVWFAAFVAPGGTRLDTAVLRAFVGVATPPLKPRILGVAVLANPLPFVVVAVALVLIALLRGRIAMAVIVGAVLGGANLLTQVLKPGLADPRILDVAGVHRDYLASWPSGHATASMSLALCAVIVAGPRWRPLAATVGASYAVAVGYALVALGWHLPSDVLGGYLVATTFALLGAAALSAIEAGRPAAVASTVQRGAAVVGPLLGAMAVVAVAATAVLTRGGAPLELTGRHALALAIGAAIAAVGVALTAGFALLLRR